MAPLAPLALLVSRARKVEQGIQGPAAEAVPTPTLLTDVPTATRPPTRVPTRGPTRVPTPTSRPVITGATSAATLTNWAQDAVVRVKAGYSSSGTGFIFDLVGETGFVVTNHHVVEGEVGSLDVVVEGRTYVGTLLGYNSEGNVDVAVLSICCNRNFHHLPWESGATGRIGSPVMAMGRPRDIPVSTTGKVIADSATISFGLIGHDAPLQEGSSGGPLLTMDGKVLGINVGSSKLTEGYFYAIPYGTVATQVVEWKSRLVVAPVLAPEPSTVEDPDMWVLLGPGDYGYLAVQVDSDFDIDRSDLDVFVDGYEYCNTNQIYGDEGFYFLSCELYEQSHSAVQSVRAQVNDRGLRCRPECQVERTADVLCLHLEVNPATASWRTHPHDPHPALVAGVQAGRCAGFAGMAGVPFVIDGLFQSRGAEDVTSSAPAVFALLWNCRFRA